MPKVPGKGAPERVLTPPTADLGVDYFLVYIPGGGKYRCKGCDALFDSFGDPETGKFGAMVSEWENRENRIGPMCPVCVAKIDADWDARNSQPEKEIDLA